MYNKNWGIRSSIYVYNIYKLYVGMLIGENRLEMSYQ